MEKRYDIKICLKGLDDADRSKLRTDLQQSSHVRVSTIESEGGIAQDILSFIIEASNSTDLPSIIKDGIVYDLIKELSRFTLDGVVMTLIVNGRKYINQSILDIKKKLGNILSKIVCHGDTLIGILEKCIDKYNEEYNEKISLEKESFLEDYFLHIDLSSNVIHFNQNIFVYLTFFYFGSPKLSHLYMLEKQLLSSGYNEEGKIVFDMLIEELKDKQDRIKEFLFINPQWITFQTLFAVMHELGHHHTSKHNDENEIVNKLLPSLIQTIDLEENLIDHDEIRLCLKDVTDGLCNDTHFLNELKADYFAIEHLVGPSLLCGLDLELANILASIFGHSTYIEYTMKIDSMFLFPHDYSKEERISDFTEKTLKCRVRLLVMAQIISIFLENLAPNKEAMSLYYNLIREPYYSHCNDFDEDFLKIINPYHECLRKGFNDSNMRLSNYNTEQDLINIESEILDLITKNLSNTFNV